MAAGTLAVFLGGAHVGIDLVSIRCFAVGQLGTHIIAAITAAQKSGQQSHIAARPAVAFGLVHIQHGLHLYPAFAGNDTLVLAH